MSMCAVEWKELGKLVKRNKGISITAGQMSELNTHNGNVRVFAAGQTIADINEDKLPHNCAYKQPSIIVKSRGYIDFEFYDKPFTHKNEMWSYSFTNKDLGKFIYYYLTTKTDYFRNKAKANSVKLPQLCVADTDNYLIPIPSLAKQQEIVSHLDTFTSLISNLESELDMRRKQYEHYRNQLLDFEGVEGVEWKTLGEVGLFYGGLSGKSKEDFQDGNAKFVTYMNIYSNSSLDTTIVDMVKVGENEKQNSINYGDILFTGSSETPDDCGMSCVVTNHVDEPIYLNSFCFGFRFNEVEKFEPSFFKHYFRCTAMRKAIAMTASGVTRFNVSKKRLGKVQMPILSINEQREISKYLDTFENLIQSLEQEIKLRKQQYEYYREKLLTFE